MKPNIVIILLDAVRAQNLPFYGYDRNTTPFLSSVADEFCIYQNAISSSYWTMPSIASLFTGTYTSSHGLLADLDKLDDALLTLPQILKNNGYRCAAFGRNIYVSDYTGLDRYFDDFYSITGIDRIKTLSGKISKRFLNDILPPGINRLYQGTINAGNSKKQKIFNTAARFVDVFMDSGGRKFVSNFSNWLKKNRSTPFFTYIHLLETHAPYRAPLNFATKFLSMQANLKKLFVNHNHLNYMLNRAPMTSQDFEILVGAYDNSICYSDYLIKKIVHSLKKYHIFDDTMVVILSDHGDNIGEHGLMSHYWCLYDTLIKIPLMIKFPAAAGMRGSVSRVVQNVDIVPTILALLEENDPKIWNQVQGNDLSGQAACKREEGIAISELVKVFGPDREKFKAQLNQYDRRLLSIRTQDLKFIHSSRGDHEFYDLAKDPTESHNLYPGDDRCSTLKEKALTYFKRMDDFYRQNIEKIDGRIEVEKADASVIERLKSLGYM